LIRWKLLFSDIYIIQVDCFIHYVYKLIKKDPAIELQNKIFAPKKFYSYGTNRI